MPRSSIIRKAATDFQVSPNWVDYDETRAEFSWENARKELAGLPGGGINIAHEAVGRHLQGAARERVAFRFLGMDGERALSYREL
ncbi:MAG: acetate--CoA ligase, partial [Bacillota bacterium]